MSHCLTKSERNYPTQKLEFLALRWAVVEKFHDYLFGNRFWAYTDNNPLTCVFRSAKLDATEHQWVTQFANYEFDIQYRSGKVNVDADTPSQLSDMSQKHQTVLSRVVEAALKAPGYAVPWISVMGCTPVDIDNGDVSPLSVVSTQDMRQAQHDETGIREALQVLEGILPEDHVSYYSC